jgi:transcriptional regulator GlxA family with amidase domain
MTGASDEAIPVAFVISQGANVIDLAGAWEVFQDVMLHDEAGSDAHRHGFTLYTVSDGAEPIQATGGLTLVPTYTLDAAPPPRVVSVGAQRGSDRIREWLRAQAETADVVMSVCTGAFHLGHAGLLDGKRATTHHDYWDAFAQAFPDVELVRGSRFVVNGNIMTAGGLTSGIGLALHVVERFYGRDAAQATAAYMEYESRRWIEGG